jgi:hypothetical protein
MAQETAHYREDVEQVRRRFGEWRSTHAVRSRLAEVLWAAAADLVQRDGIDATARALDVDKPSLRKWAERLQPERQPTARRSPPKRRLNAMPAFVELLASGSSTATSCLVEVESPRGGKLRLELKAIATSQLAELIRAFATM